MRFAHFIVAGTAVFALATGAYAQDAGQGSSTSQSGQMSSSLPEACRAAAQGMPQHRMMQGKDMQGGMMNMQSSDMSEAQKADMAAMMKMHHAMMTGMHAKDPDISFACSMLPHHQGAIDMARVQLQYGKDAELKRMAEKSIAEQEKEIGELNDWIDKHAAK